MSKKKIKSSSSNNKSTSLASKKSIAKLVLCTIFGISVWLLLAGVVVLFQNVKDLNDGSASLDYDSMDYEVTTYDTSNLSDYMVSLDDYIEIRKNKRIEELNDIKELLGEDVYETMVGGLDSEYFLAYCSKEYTTLYNNLNNMMAQIPYISNAFHDAREKDNSIKVLDSCIVPNCDLLNYLSTYAKGDLLETLKETHLKYETLVNAKCNELKATEEVDEAYKNMYYQEYLCTDLSLVDDIKVDWKLMDNQGRVIFNKTFTEEDLDVLENLRLYNCHGFYDDDFHELAADTMNSMTLDFAGNPIFTCTVDYSLAGLDERDKFTGAFTVEDCKHTKDIKPLDDSWNDKAYISKAEEIVYNAILDEITESREESNMRNQVTDTDDTATNKE